MTDHIDGSDCSPLPDDAAELSAAEATGRLPLHTYRWTDYGNAERLVALHGDDLRYCHIWERWFIWDGARWQHDQTREIVRRCKATARAMYDDLPLMINDSAQQTKYLSWIRQSEKKSHLRNMQDLAASESAVGVTPDLLDADPMLLAVANGTLDLRTGEHRPSDRADLITRQSAVGWEAGARAPTWERFLVDVFPDPDLRAYVQRAAGYSLTGRTDEHVFFIAYGSGANGKSTFLETMRTLIGSYAQALAADTLVVKRNGGGIPNDVARMDGARFITAAETAEGEKLNEALVKQITGGDTIAARFMRADFFDFTPKAKLWVATNHRPRISGTDNGIWRRVHLLPFVVSFPPERQDRELSRKLEAELPGILNWAIEGCLRWQREGLQPPTIVRAATDEYREDMDVLAVFLQEKCVVGPEFFVANELLYTEYVSWCKRNGHNAFARPQLLRQLFERNGGEFKRGRKRDGGAGTPRPCGVIGLGLQPACGSSARSSVIKIAGVSDINAGRAG